MSKIKLGARLRYRTTYTDTGLCAHCGHLRYKHNSSYPCDGEPPGHGCEQQCLRYRQHEAYAPRVLYSLFYDHDADPANTSLRR